MQITAARLPVVAMIGAGALAITPIAPVHPAGPPALSVAVQNTAMAVELVNPFDAFRPVMTATFEDLYFAVQDAIDDPFPVVRSVLSNQTTYFFTAAFGLAKAGNYLGSGAFELPGQLLAATQLALSGDVEGALQTIKTATLEPLSEAAKVVTNAVQRIVGQQIAIVQNLITAVPQAGGLVLAATVNAVKTIIAASLEAGKGVLDAVKTVKPVAVWNAVVQGAADVALVAEGVTIGNGLPQDTAETVASKTVEVQAAPASIKLGLLKGRALINDALHPIKKVADAAPAAATSAKSDLKSPSGKREDTKRAATSRATK